MPPKRTNNQAARTNNQTNTPSQQNTQTTQASVPSNQVEPGSDDPNNHKNDPIRSNDQTKDVFWKRVAEDYNKFTGGPHRAEDRLSARWKIVQNSCLKFTAIHDRLEKNPASGSSPEDWLNNAKTIYYEQVGKTFSYERPWNLLRHVEKFKSLAGRAKNGAPPSTQNQTSQGAGPASPPDATNATSNAGSKGKDWERPIGAHAAKQQANEEEYKRKKLKLLEASHKESVKRSAEAKRSNDIQADLVAGEQKKIDVNLMFQNPANCPDDISRQFLLAQKQKIFTKWMDPSFDKSATGESSQTPADQSSQAPTDRSTQLAISEPDEQNAGDDEEEQDDEEEYKEYDYNEGDPLPLYGLDASVDPTLY
ncbi:uncharacterized protein PGTG_13331 [Puccinia graminis f. sp. tritici CRL 75-36-700-3]|uniref:No apical meristem-associated C-terminal domain-containing protein n=1 Tax=Puccinia graminis f. sp. tritici (strain CRL 75-36-700-3 / race SCCL) TaxID=418459 RepID=E3KS37_PUCGT|nr:uncharacterized protein PGTG_13331 [Puccinia graminis f. sp. tritici CRL 75-36-700-3]EFP87112.1 hypothetical protein PGTG_13331 [Puccinia graminis f. sp. tritici CRL 75-36-700-3]